MVFLPARTSRRVAEAKRGEEGQLERTRGDSKGWYLTLSCTRSSAKGERRGGVESAWKVHDATRKEGREAEEIFTP